MSKKVELTRRRVLGGLGTIGVAGAAAGLGTSAYFNDEESFTENSITAGTLDMSVTATVEAASSYWSSAVDMSATADGEAVSGVTVNDVKPGDWGIICFDISIGENPGYVQVSTAELTSSENDYTEPESEDENGEGELEDAILATIWDSYDDTTGDRSGLSTLDPTTDNNDSGLASYETPNEGGETAGGAHYTTLQEAYDEYNTGVTLGGIEEPASINSAEFCLLLEIPDAVGNEIQSDSVSFDLVFNAEQSRNNDDPFSGGGT